MPRIDVKKGATDLPEDRWLFRYWVEVRDLRDGSMRTLPLSGITKIYLPSKASDPGRPNEQVLHLQDESGLIEGKDIDDIAAQLRTKYPDESHERFLRRERDRDAEQRHAAAIEELIEIIAKAVVDKAVRDQRAAHKGDEAPLS